MPPQQATAITRGGSECCTQLAEHLYRCSGVEVALSNGFVCRCRNSAWSPIRSAFSLVKFFFITSTATATAWYAHPHLLNLAAHVLHLDFKDSVTAFQTSFFSFLSLVFAIYSGNTMAFLYDVRPNTLPCMWWCVLALLASQAFLVNAIPVPLLEQHRLLASCCAGSKPGLVCCRGRKKWSSICTTNACPWKSF